MSKSCLLGAVLAAGLTLATAAGASVITSDATLPVLGVPFAASGAGSCFPGANVCSQFGALTFTSVITSAINGTGQDILANAFITGELTDTSFHPLGLVTLTGTVEQEVIGRMSATETGTWATELLAVTLTGTVLGRTLTLTLDPGTPSTGATSVVPIGGGGGQGGGGLFRIDSFFDVFVDLTLNTPTPLHTTRSSHLELAPEPASVAIMTVGLLSLAAARRRRRQSVIA